MNIVVVGASRGIGLELVHQCLAAGNRVWATARTEPGIADLNALGAAGLQLDVADPASCDGFAQALSNLQFDQAWYVSGLLVGRLAAPDTPTQADFDAVMRTNVWGAMRLLPALGATLVAGGKLITLSSQMGSLALRTNANAWLYRASKTAVNSVVRDMSFALEGRAVCVALHPGWVQTDMGGTGADLAVGSSVANMRATVARFGGPDNGGFFNHDGNPLDW